MIATSLRWGLRKTETSQARRWGGRRAVKSEKASGSQRKGELFYFCLITPFQLTLIHRRKCPSPATPRPWPAAQGCCSSGRAAFHIHRRLTPQPPRGMRGGKSCVKVDRPAWASPTHKRQQTPTRTCYECVGGGGGGQIDCIHLHTD